MGIRAALLAALCGGALALRVGVQSPPGSPNFAQYAPTFRYIGEVTGLGLDPVPFLTDSDLAAAANNGSIQLTFSGATPTYCIILTTNLQPIVTLISVVNGQPTPSIAADIVVLQQSPVQHLADLRGQLIGVGQLNSLALTQAQWGLLQMNNVSLFADTRGVAFLASTQNIVGALMAGSIDVGFLPANFFETTHVDPTLFRVIDARQSTDYPYPSTTGTFSSQVLGTLPSINGTTRTALARAFLNLAPNASVVQQGGYYGWGTPQSFLTIRKLLQSTNVLKPNAERCSNLSMVFAEIPCPPGYGYQTAVAISQMCERRGVQCPANATCVCSPCARIIPPKRIGGLVPGAFAGVIVAVVSALLVLALWLWQRYRTHVKVIPWHELEMEDTVLGHGSLGLVRKARHQGVAVVVKRAFPRKEQGHSIFDFDDLELQRQLLPHNRNRDECLKRKVQQIGWQVLRCIGVQTERTRQIKIVAARADIKLRHSNIVPTLGVCLGEDGQEVLSVTLYMERGSLHDLITNPSIVLDIVLTTSIARDIASALLWCHAQDPSIIGLNLQPQHVLMDSNLRAHLSSSAPQAFHESVLMAPELLLGRRQTEATDVYAYGMLLYMLLFRHEPFLGEDRKAVFRAIRDSEGGVQKRPDVEDAPPQIRELLEQCWDPDPVQRPTFAEICKALAGGRQSLADDLMSKVHQGQALLNQVYPPNIARALQEGRIPEPEQHNMVTIFFSDIVGFTRISSVISPEEVMRMLHQVYTSMDTLAHKHGVFKVETIGDAWSVINCLEKVSYPALHTASSCSLLMQDGSHQPQGAAGGPRCTHGAVCAGGGQQGWGSGLPDQQQLKEPRDAQHPHRPALRTSDCRHRGRHQSPLLSFWRYGKLCQQDGVLQRGRAHPDVSIYGHHGHRTGLLAGCARVAPPRPGGHQGQGHDADFLPGKSAAQQRSLSPILHAQTI